MLLVAEYSYATNVTVPTKIKDVTIYLSGASLSCVADAKIPAGVSTVTLTDLPTAISEESIQLEGVGDFVINNVLYRVPQWICRFCGCFPSVSAFPTDRISALCPTQPC